MAISTAKALNQECGIPAALLGGGLFALLLACNFIYASALSGPSLLDDLWNLQWLGAGGGVHNLVNFLRFVFANDSGATERPLSILYFLIDGQDWPPYVMAFKHTNLKLHLLTGALTTIAISATHAVCLNCDERHARSVAYKAIKLAFINRGLC